MIKRWERFWFAEVPSEAFALIRIVVGAAGLVSLIGFTPISMFWWPDGIAPLPEPGGVKSYLLESGFGEAAGWTLFLLLFASFACMTAGLFTGWAVAACFLGSVLQSRWNSLPLTSGHTVLVAVLFCLLWANCGARLSFDTWRRGRSMIENAQQPIWPMRLIRAQIALLYATSGFFKLLGPAWRSGSAVHYTTEQNVYGRVFHVYGLPDNLDWALSLVTYATLFWELGFPFLLWHRLTRRLALLTGVAIHLGVWATMEVGPFTWVVLASYVAFLDPHAVRRLSQRLSSRLPTVPNEKVVPGAAIG
jgi:hypothetical protein